MIGVCIKYFHENYGGMLQAYATASYLEKIGLDYELIRYEKKHTPLTIVKALPRLLNGVLLNDKYEALIKKLGKKKHPEFAAHESERMEAFRRFKETHFTKLSPVYVGYEALCSGAVNYNAVVTGSDQLWSPAGLPTNFYNLMFVPAQIRKISIASSFGVKEIPWYQRRRTADFLKRIDHVSMRENSGAEIVKELTGREVPVILDPVFLFDKDGWEQMIPVQREFEEPYIFAYFLGNNPEQRTAVKLAAEQLGCKIVTLRHLDRYIPEDEQFGDYAPYDIAPDRFLNLLRGAAYVCTDSFHGACFSVIHGKQFVVFNRYSDNFMFSKNSRIDTLCGNLGLQDRRFAEHSILAEQLQAAIDYEAVQDRFAQMKQETDSYLASAFEGIV